MVPLLLWRLLDPGVCHYEAFHRDKTETYKQPSRGIPYATVNLASTTYIGGLFVCKTCAFYRPVEVLRGMQRLFLSRKTCTTNLEKGHSSQNSQEPADMYILT